MVDLHDILLGDVIPESGVSVSIGRNTYDGAAATVPLHDIHTRQLDYHDSGDPGGSGIVQYNALSNVLTLNPGCSGKQTITTAVIFDAYDGTGGDAITTSDTVVTIDTVRYNSHADIFTLASNVLQINMSGVYEINYRCSADNGTGTRTNAEWYVQRQEPGGSFAAINGTESYTYHRTTANGEGTSSGRAVIDFMRPGDKIRVMGVVVAGTTSIPLIIDGSALMVRKLG